MRRLLLVSFVLLVSASAITGVRLEALSDCQRWIAEYRDAVAHSPVVQRAKAAGHRLHRKVAVSLKPKARALSVRYVHPKMTREEALRAMEFACGDMAPLVPGINQLAENETPIFFPPAADTPVEEADPAAMATPSLTPEPPNGGQFSTFPPIAPSFLGVGGGSFPGGGGKPGTGGLPVVTPLLPPGKPEQPSGSGDPLLPQFPPPPGIPGTTDHPPTAVTPEPGTLLLLATGLVGAATMIRRRGVSA
jgi:hypothetical protein